MTEQEKKASEKASTAVNKKKDGISKGKSKPKKSKKKIVVLSIIAILVLAGAAVGYYLYHNSQTRFETANLTGETLSNEVIEVTITRATEITEITGYELDENYIYIAVRYKVHNKSTETIDWEEYPYISIMKYTYKNGYYIPVEDSEAEFDFNALQLYSIEKGLDYSGILDGLEADDTRWDADIIKIPKNEYDPTEFFITIDVIDAIVMIEE